MLVNNYGPSKAAINFVVQRIHVEHPTIIAFPLHPGVVWTDMHRRSMKASGMDDVPGGTITAERSAEGILKLLDESTRETHSGKFWNVADYKELPW